MKMYTYSSIVKQEPIMKITPLPNIRCGFFWSFLPLAPGRKGISTTWTLKGFRPGKKPKKKPGIYREFVEFYGSLWWIYEEFVEIYVEFMESFKGIVTNTNCELMGS